MIGIPVGLLVANAGEWFIHKHVLHGQGRKRGSFWSFHWFEHHGASRRANMVDADYRRSPFTWNAQGKELFGLCAMAVPIAALFPIAPFFSATILYSEVRYYRAHKRAHLDPDWAREHLPWHYDHHMGPDQDLNWCVTRPWFDTIMGTRAPYVGTEKELRDYERRKARAKAAADKATPSDTTGQPRADAASGAPAQGRAAS